MPCTLDLSRLNLESGAAGSSQFTVKRCELVYNSSLAHPLDQAGLQLQIPYLCQEE